MHPVVLLTLLSSLALPLGVDELVPEDPLGLGETDAQVSARVGDVAVHVDTNDVGLFLTTALPGPGFSRPIEDRLPLDAGMLLGDGETASDGPAIPVRMPQPSEAAVPAGLAVLGWVAYAAFRWRFIGPWFLVPLYSRLNKGELLENDVRAKLHDLVTADPGLSLQDLCQRSGAGWGTTVYHLQRLEQAGMVTSKKQGHHRRFYVQGEVDRRDMAALGMLRNETPAKIARYLLESPGCNQKAVCEALGISPSLAHKHLKRLEAQNLVSTERQWRSVHYTPDPKLGELLAQAA